MGGQGGRPHRMDFLPTTDVDAPEMTSTAHPSKPQSGKQDT